jgi:hypothetical protein
MRRFFALLVLTCTILGVAPLGAADDEEKKPKFPEKDAFIPGPFHVLNLNGARKGRYHCLICRNGLNPVAAIFVQPKVGDGTMADWAKKDLANDAPLSALCKKLDTISVNNPDAFLGAFVVFSVKEDDQVPLINRAEALVKDLNLKNIIFCVGADDEPKDWFEKRDWETAVLLYQQHKVVDFQTFDKDKLTEKEVDALAKAYDGMVPFYARPGYRPKLKLPKQ